MQDNRPVNLDLTKFHFPPMAILSISHRISGCLLFLAIPFLLYLLCYSLGSPAQFDRIQYLLHYNAWPKMGVWVALSATALHLLAGIRHLLMDLGFGESVRAGKLSAYLVFLCTIVAIVLLGVWIWR